MNYNQETKLLQSDLVETYKSATKEAVTGAIVQTSSLPYAAKWLLNLFGLYTVYKRN